MDFLEFKPDAESRMVTEIVLSPFGRAPSDSIWIKDTLVLFDDAILTPNSSWESVNDSYVVQLVKKLLRADKYGLRRELCGNFTFLRDTEGHRRAALSHSFHLRFIKQVYRFTAAEIRSSVRLIDHMPQTGYIEAGQRKRQLFIWRRFGICNGCEFPREKSDMYLARDGDTILGFLLFNLNAHEPGPMFAINVPATWALLHTLVSLRLYDESQCLTVCTSLLKRSVASRLTKHNGSFLFSVTIASLNEVEVV